MDRHTLDTVCRTCGENVTWAVVRFHRPDGYSDWRLDVSCVCGTIDDSDRLEEARKAHDGHVGGEIAREQARALGRLSDILEVERSAR